ncbi:hypothetical protein, partial [Nitrospira sp. BLG_2]|uniref:hypothetical protein n=1 Tax=Nitrospira sp. BLG_2 TaxID=3397507 RepID=UPI003B9D7E3C
VLFSKLVPNQGKCETLEGETLRAINRIIYRYYNDGDYWFTGYGCETAGPAETFIRQYAPIDLRPELLASDCSEDKDYEKQLEIMLEKILTYIESRTQYAPNYQDMLDCESKYEDDDEEEYEEEYEDEEILE